MIPMVDSPHVAVALAARWRRARVLVLVSMMGLPALLGLICLTFALLPLPDVSTVTWAVIPVVVATLSAFALVTWLRRDGLTDPASWLPATVLMTSSQVVLGVVPGFGIAMRSATGTALVLKALLALGVVSAGSAWSLARRACRSLLASPVAELGSTPLQLEFRSSLSRIVIGADRVDWTCRTAGGRLDLGVSFRNLHAITVASADDAAIVLVLHTSSGRWRVPAREAAAVCAVLRQRKVWWERRAEAAIEQERARYHEMLRLIGAAKATSSTEDGSVSVTVNADGVATGIELTEGIRGKSPQLISADLMACIDQAQKTVRKQVQHLMVTRYVTKQRKEELPVLAQRVSERIAA
ncbi:YbaB/EbfC family nucleoid-associated protein [Lentzea sp. BCCO 10_0856]|uniref:YbaB/EbfC family nucleoid-associated protein n=1 Tax=Lentzea miocenica TaxID=3095431 RepID=A0ABU4T9P8_9PSEU|nr:YbaB/EbfC family nucleoid-associated protein [Lentzea sp. BCCO 10_0856]MDX8034891.1 YbaB/EbfC family nucleoid-associated protein [Lentzea sp. BCCO 10_0856]